jgi:hypothetical protein
MDDYKNALPDEVDDRRDSGMPRQLRTQADKLPPLSRREADVAGIGPTPETTYGDDSYSPNEDDQRDVHHGAEDDAT